MTEADILRLSALVGEKLKARGATLTCAESCTGGWLAKSITDIAGSSGWFDYGFVTYSNLAKQRLVNVNAETLEQHGAVSEAVVNEMAAGALQAADADFAISVSGVAGPDGEPKRSLSARCGLASLTNRVGHSPGQCGSAETETRCACNLFILRCKRCSTRF